MLPTIKCIPGQMSFLFYNLLNNALKFSKKNMIPKIRISSKPLWGSEIKKIPGINTNLQYYNIYIQDNGIGFAWPYVKR